LIAALAGAERVLALNTDSDDGAKYEVPAATEKAPVIPGVKDRQGQSVLFEYLWASSRLLR
jgi:hypothetical protein